MELSEIWGFVSDSLKTKWTLGPSQIDRFRNISMWSCLLPNNNHPDPASPSRDDILNLTHIRFHDTTTCDIVFPRLRRETRCPNTPQIRQM